MLNKPQWITSIATPALLSLLLAGCGTSAPENSSATTTDSGNASEPTLVMATSADYKPYEFHDTSSGQDKIVGFDIDVANAIAQKLHFKYTVQDMDFNGLIGTLQSGRADFVIAGMTPTADRKKSVDFSQLYYQANNVVLTKKGLTITNLTQLKGKSVAAQLASTQEDVAKSIPGVKVDAITSIPNVVQQVVTNRDQAAVIEDMVAKGYIKSIPDLQMNQLPGLTSDGSAIAFPQGSKWVSKFNSAISQMKQDGELANLEAKWFGSGGKTS